MIRNTFDGKPLGPLIDGVLEKDDLAGILTKAELKLLMTRAKKTGKAFVQVVRKTSDPKEFGDSWSEVTPEEGWDMVTGRSCNFVILKDPKRPLFLKILSHRRIFLPDKTAPKK